MPFIVVPVVKLSAVTGVVTGGMGVATKPPVSVKEVGMVAVLILIESWAAVNPRTLL